MKLHTVFITFNRLELTKQAIASYLETVTVPYSFLIVDNGSTDGTQEWIKQTPYVSLLFPENRYPGYATNAGWELAPPDATHLHRADNDFRFLPEWCAEVERKFQDSKVGQVGLRTPKEEDGNRINVGGNCVIRRELWDQGLRWDERPWPEYDPGWTEDAFLSLEIEKMGYLWKRVKRPCIVPLASGDWNDDYYRKSFGDRGLVPPEDLLSGS